MRITNFIKNYPFLMFSFFFLFVCIALLLIENEVYAYKEKSNPNCICKNSCKPSPPNTYPIATYSCTKDYFDISQQLECSCLGLQGSYFVMVGAWEECRRRSYFSCTDCSVPGACDPSCKNRCRIRNYTSFCTFTPQQGGNGYECKDCYYDFIVYDEYGFPQKYQERACKKDDCK